MKQFYRFLLASLVALVAGVSAKAIGWPANYQGVMLQGFYWDSYSDTKWSTLEANADEYSKYFSLIWVPNSAKAEGSPSMGYHPVYWFTNHNSSFGTESQLRSMIKTFKEKGTGIIADVVINHRSGVSNWTNFPSETWNGKTYKIGPEGICRNDEVNGVSGQAQPTGNYDTGENWDGSRDLDHTNANVQANCKDYVKCLLTDYGYAGVRYDFVKGYSPQYTKMYNQANNVKYSVGEYWDGSYDAVKNWIEGTGKESAAFDFPFKYAVNEAFHSNDMTKLVWKANGTTDQPAGMIHFGYAQLAVTFIDNHDTYRDGSKFNGDVLAANAFMLFSPGTPCVFLAHYKANKAAIQKLIDIRNACGIHNCSEVKVLKSANNIYMAEIKGTKGTAVVRIGSATDTPSGYSSSDIKASGSKYCVWTKVGVTPGPTPTPGSTPDKLYVMGNLEQGSWKTNVGVSMTKSGNKFTANNVKLVAQSGESKAFFSFVTVLGTTGANSEWDGVINGSDRYGATSENAPLTAGTSAPMKLFAANVDASSAYSWGVAEGSYTVVADFDAMTVTVTKTGDTPTPGEPLYMMGFVNGHSFDDTTFGLKQSSVSGNVYKWDSATISDAGAGLGYINFATVLGELGTKDDWDTYINSGVRYGAPANDTPLSIGTPASVKKYTPGVDCSACKSWAIPTGTYVVTLDLGNMKISLTAPSGIEDVTFDNNAPAVYYNLQGVRVEAPQHGVFIEVRGGKSRKVAL